MDTLTLWRARLYDRGLKTVAWSASKSGEIKTSSVQLDTGLVGHPSNWSHDRKGQRVWEDEDHKMGMVLVIVEVDTKEAKEEKLENDKFGRALI